MRKRRAFADRDLEAVMYQREQQQQQSSAITTNKLPEIINAEHHHHHQNTFRFHPHLPLFFGLMNHQEQHPSNSVTIKLEESDNSDDSEVDIEVEDDIIQTHPVKSNNNKISFSVESIIGRK